MNRNSISALVYPELKTTYKLGYSSTNFQIWEMKLGFVLVDHNVAYVLTVPKPAEPVESTSPDAVSRYKKWVSDDFTARHIILGTLHDTLFLSYNKLDTAKSLMEALIRLFTKPCMARRMVLLKRYVENRMDENKPMNKHISEMRSMARELEFEGAFVPEELQAVMLMNSLPENWEDEICKTVLLLDIRDELSLEKVSNRLKKVGAWKEMQKARDEEKSLWNGKVKKEFKGKSYSCGKFVDFKL